MGVQHAKGGFIKFLDCDAYLIPDALGTQIEHAESLAGDSIVSDKKIDLIKIDVEGMELIVLKGFEMTQSRWKPYLMIEISRQNFDLCHNYLVGLGFKSLFSKQQTSEMSDNIYGPA